MKWLVILAELPDDHWLIETDAVSVSDDLYLHEPERKGQQVIYHQRWGVPPS